MRVPHTNSYTLTPDGLAAIFYTKVDNRVCTPHAD